MVLPPRGAPWCAKNINDENGRHSVPKTTKKRILHVHCSYHDPCKFAGRSQLYEHSAAPSRFLRNGHPAAAYVPSNDSMEIVFTLFRLREAKSNSQAGMAFASHADQASNRIVACLNALILRSVSNDDKSSYGNFFGPVLRSASALGECIEAIHAHMWV